jgi:hypothetical protein
MTTRSTTRTINSYRFTSNDKVAQNLTKRKSIIGAIQGFGKPVFTFDYLIVGGGGGGGASGGGGGGGGGIVTGTAGLTNNPDYTGASFTASFWYQPTPGTNRNEMQVSAVSSGRIKVGQRISGPGIPPATYILTDRGGNGGVGNYSVSTTVSASTPSQPSYPGTASPTATPVQANVLTPRSVSSTGGFTYNTPVNVVVGGGGSPTNNGRGGTGGQSYIGSSSEYLAYGGGGGGGAIKPGGSGESNSSIHGQGADLPNPGVAGAGGQSGHKEWLSSAPYNFVAGGYQGGYGGASWRPGAPSVDVRNGGSGGRGGDNPFPGYSYPPVSMSAMPSLLQGYGGGGGGAGGWDSPSPSEAGRGGDGGEGYRWPYTSPLSYGSGGGGSSYNPTNNMSPAGYGDGGMGAVYRGGDDFPYPGSPTNNNPTAAPFGSKSGYGDGPNGDNNNIKAMANRGGGGGGRYESVSTGGGFTWAPFGTNIWSPATGPASPTRGDRSYGDTSGAGGSGVVIIRYPAVFGNVSNSGSPDVSVTPTGFIHYTFTGSGSINFDFPL